MKPTDKKWKDRSTKEKLDFVFVIVAILGFSLGAIVNYKNLKKMK
jgi:hypothetical protein|tara:strand:- start:1472 stop:1606 length:135 start_codon:yes stop_codon:yes gene_type:complete